jgi:hypothetical protein
MKMGRLNYSGAIGDNKAKPSEKPLDKNKSFDEMTKDELLDYTAINNIEADYSMTKKEIKQKIKGN